MANGHRRPALRRSPSTATSTPSTPPTPSATSAYGWWSITGGGDPAEGSVEGLLGAHDLGGADRRHGLPALRTRSRVVARSPRRWPHTDGVDVELGQAVSQVVSTTTTRSACAPSHASVHGVRRRHGRPGQHLPDIRFTPSLPDRTRGRVRPQRRPGVQGVAAHPRRPAPRAGVRSRPRRQLDVRRPRRRRHHARRRLRLAGRRLRPHRPRATSQQALHRFFPDAELLEHTTHDWITDSASLGTWVNPIAGESHRLLRAESFPPPDASRSPRPTSPPRRRLVRGCARVRRRSGASAAGRRPALTAARG